MKRMTIIALIMSVCLGVSSAFASIPRAKIYFDKNRRSVKYYPEIARELVRGGLYFTAIPFLKEYLVTNRVIKSKELDRLIDKVVTEVGVKQFEVLPISVLKRTSAPIVKYILAKKYFRLGKYQSALKELKGTIPNKHSAKPFALFLEGSIYSIKGKYKTAKRLFDRCVDVSEDQIDDTNDETKIKQLATNRDYCIVGVPRAQFAAGKFKAAHSGYLDLPKNSHIWPEILFEEAWTSFYLKDYNRTLGKLVTYNAPIFSYIFNPEIEVLKAMTYLELCLWGDAKQVVDNFYRTYQREAKRINADLSRIGKNYKYFYQLGKARIDGKVDGGPLKNKILKAVIGDSAYGEMYTAFKRSTEELTKVKQMKRSRFKSVLSKNLRDALLMQRNLIGGYVRKGMLDYSRQMGQAFEGMSYIKLEVLSRRKAELYNIDLNDKRSRGDIVNLKRNDKQYFWSFNGEFWADELGDYVFSLKSECRK